MVKQKELSQYWKSFFLFVLQMYICISLMSSAFIHFTNPLLFYESILRYQLISVNLSAFTATLLMHLSAILGLAVLFRTFCPFVYVWTSILGFMFLLAQILSLINGNTISCGCFGASSDAIGIESISMALILIVASIIVGFADRTSSHNFRGVAPDV
jgi:hypothetical protein